MGIDSLLAKLNRHGYRVTRQRKLVLMAIGENACLQSAEDIYERCRREDKSISMPTVYRTLEMLVELGQLRKLNYDSERAWFEPVRGEHHHHMICQRCGAKAQISQCPGKLIDELAAANNFQVLDHRFEIFGICGSCRGKEEDVS
ncbi:MAG: transcriptional repressor [Firmicutes bacterium]|nr:transcriptional repressor [Bacillota bacterium]